MTAEIVAFGQFDTKPDASGEFSPAAGAGQEMWEDFRGVQPKDQGVKEQHICVS